MAKKSRFHKVAPAASMMPVFTLVLWFVIGISPSLHTMPAFAMFQEATPQATPTAIPSTTPTSSPTPVSGANIAIESSSEGELVSDQNGNGLIDPGDTVRLGITYRNTGTETLTDVKVIADYDQAFVAGIANPVPAGSDDKDKITWDLGTLAPGDSLSIAYEVTLKDRFLPQGSITIENKFEISSEQMIPASTRQLVTVRVPNLKISKNWELIGDMDADGRPGPGDTLRYTLKLQNVGDVAAANILIEDDYVQSLLSQPSGVSDGGVDNGDIISWHLDQLGPKADKSVAYDVTLKSTFPLGITSIINQVGVSATGIELITGRSSFDVEVIPSPTPAPTSTEAPPISTPIPPYEPAGPTTTGLANNQLTWLAIGFIILAIAGVGVIGYLSYSGKGISDALRDSFLLALIMSSLIILGLAGSVERSAIAGLIGTIAGYVLRSVTSMGGSSGGAGGG